MPDVILENDKLFQSETGTVTAVEGGRALVRLTRTKACEFCGQCSVSKEDGMMELQADVPPGEDIAPGDRVELVKKPGYQAGAILLLLLLPLAGLLLGAGMGYLLFPENEVFEALTALLGLTAAFVLSLIITRIKKWHRGAGLTLKKL